jgi:hypothetical protein
MVDDPHQRFCIRPLGSGDAPADAIAVGSLHDMFVHLPQTAAREQRERQLADAQVIHEFRIAVDSAELAERERDVEAVKASADAIVADAVKRFVADVSALSRRMDALEQARHEQQLRDEIADADLALGDDGPLEIHEPSADRDREELEARNPGSSEVETAIEKDDDLLDGRSPSLPQRAPEIYRPTEPMGALSESKADSDMQRYGRTFLTNRDRKAWRRQQLRGTHR